MSVHLEKVLRHAEAKLIASAQSEPTHMLDLYRRFLKIEEHRLFLAHRAGEGGVDLAHKRADLIDVLLRHLWANSIESAQISHDRDATKIQMALVATGGFGRGELSPFSDVDVLFLFEDAKAGTARRRWVEDVVQQVLYMLWDIGFKVGHALRTVQEAIEQCHSDLQTRTALLESRLITGSAALFEEFRRRFQRQCIEGKEMAYLQWRMLDQAERHAKYGGTVFVQEPQLKNGCGGLRDYQNLLWMARVRRETFSTADLQQEGILTPTERKTIDQAYEFITRLRNELHYQQKHPGDILTLKMQGRIANSFQYPQKNILRRTEALMRDYYRHARALFLISNGAARKLVGQDRKQSGLFKLIPAALRRPKVVDAFIFEQGEVWARSRSVFNDDPLRLLRLFQILQQHDAVMSGDLESLVRARSHLINGRFLYLADAREIFSNILRQKGRVGRIIRAMHETGVLGRILPEFAPLTCLVQHEFFHRYTADEHTLKCVEELDRIIDAQNKPHQSYRELLASVEEADVLYLAMIMHDVGKASNSRHHQLESAQMAARVARRMKFQGKRLRLFIFLVDHHQTLSEYAQRRNLDDPAVIRDFARIVETPERLDYLMLITFADAQGTGGENNWTNWKELLVWQLYYRTRTMLTGEKEFLAQEVKRRENLRTEIFNRLPKTIPKEEVQAHFDLLPADYCRNSAKMILRHIELVHHFLLNQFSSPDAALRPQIDWIVRTNEAHTEVSVVTWNRENLFGRITGALALAELNILSANIYRRADDICIETFRICTERFTAVDDKRDRRLFEKYLWKVLDYNEYDEEGELSKLRANRSRERLSEEVFPTVLHLDNDSSTQCSILDVRTPDYIGLLHDLANLFWSLGLEVQEARVATEKGAAFDTFHLTEIDGGKLESPERQRQLLHEVEHFLSRP